VRYYGKPSLCPCCKDAVEDIDPMMSCPSPLASEFCQEALKQFTIQLQNIGTPDQIICTLSTGVTIFFQNSAGIPVTRQASSGSASPIDILASHCLSNKSSLGWDQFLHGRISKSWRKFFYHLQHPSDNVVSLWSK
jgi:hypothetical protein